MNLETILTCPVHKTAGRWIAEIHRIRAVQELIAAADHALKQGQDEVLRHLGFGDEHIAELKKLAVTSINSAFPSYVRKNNKRMIRVLRRKVRNLKCTFCDRLAECPESPVDAPTISHAEQR
jgi:hypothetical protein